MLICERASSILQVRCFQVFGSDKLFCDFYKRKLSLIRCVFQGYMNIIVLTHASQEYVQCLIYCFWVCFDVSNMSNLLATFNNFLHSSDFM